MNWLDLLGSWSLHKHCNPHASPHRLIATAGNHASGKPSHKSHGRRSAKVDCATRQAFHQSRNGSACCGGPVLITMLHSRVLLSRRTRHFFVDHLHCPPWLFARPTNPHRWAEQCRSSGDISCGPRRSYSTVIAGMGRCCRSGLAVSSDSPPADWRLFRTHGRGVQRKAGRHQIWICANGLWAFSKRASRAQLGENEPMAAAGKRRVHALLLAPKQ